MELEIRNITMLILMQKHFYQLLGFQSLSGREGLQYVARFVAEEYKSLVNSLFYVIVLSIG